LKDNEDIEIEDLEELCQYCPETDACKQFVQEYFDELVKMIEEDVDAEEFCEEVQACSASWLNFQPMKTSNDEVCQFCISGLEYLKEELKDDEDVEIEDLEKVCQYSSDPDTCKKFVTEYFDEIVRLIEDDLDTKEACEEIQLCTAFRLQPESATDDECELCKLEVKSFKDLENIDLGDPETVCEILGFCPSSLRSKVSAALLLPTEMLPMIAPSRRTDEQLRKLILSRRRRDVTMEDALGFGQLLLARIHLAAKRHACLACKLIASHTSDDISSNPLEFNEHMERIRAEACNVGEGSCLDVTSIDSILALAEESDEPCPIQGLCDENTDVSPEELIRNAMCETYKKMFSHVNNDDSWDQLKAELDGQLVGKPAEKVMIFNALDNAKSSQQMLNSPMGDEEKPKMALFHELMREHVIGEDCEMEL
jgi:hypothetical protein